MSDPIEYHKVTATSLGDDKRVMLAQLRGLGDDADDDGAEPTDDAEVIQPLGLVTRPEIKSSLEAVVFRDGDEVVVLCLVDKAMTPRLDETPALEEGETRLYGAKERGAMVRLKANGDVVIVPKSGQKLYLGGDSDTQPCPLGTDLNTYLGELRDKINGLRDDLGTVAAHTHTSSCTAGGASIPASMSLTSVPTVAEAGDPPDLSTVVESK